MNHKAMSQIGLSVLILLSLTTPLCLQNFSHAQEPSATPEVPKATVDRAELYQALLDLTSPWTLMCVAAHPDDEDGTTLTMMRRKYGVHTVSLFSTYGEGGQNAVGPQLYQELGVIRAHETIAASAIQGSEPYFLGLSDFGFSKSAEETFRIWGEKEALRRMVLKIRQLRPDVIITNHNTVSGHGQHQATGRLLLQAFDAAADPNSFPEQLKEVTVWQPQRLFVRFGFDSNPETKALEQAAEMAGKIVTVDPNEKDPIRNTTFAEQALAALQKHATQGPWPKSIAERLRSQNRTELPKIRYRLAKESSSVNALSGINKNFVEGLRLPLTTGSKLAPPAIHDRPLTDLIDRREEALVALINARRAGVFTAPPDVVKIDSQRFRLMSSRLDQALAVASGTSLSLASTDNAIVPGFETQFTSTIANSGDADVEVKRMTFNGWGTNRPLDIAEKLPIGTDTAVTVKVTTPKPTTITVPAAEHLYDGRFLGERLTSSAELEIEGARFSIQAEIRVPIVPPIEIKAISPSLQVITPAFPAELFTYSLTLTNHVDTPLNGTVTIESSTRVPHTTTHKISLAADETREVKLPDRNSVPPRELLSIPPRSGTALITARSADPASPISQRTVMIAYADAKTRPNLKVGYIPSFDDTLKNALAVLGVESAEISVKDVQSGDLDGFDSIVIDNRGYFAHPELVAANQKLLDYVRNGGTLIIFYHKTNEWNPDEKRNRPQLAPYPIILGDERVTEEDAPVKLLRPTHPLLRIPNNITQADFRNWIQERGLYYPQEWDPHYTALLSTSDHGEPPLTGGLLVAKYGKGYYIYTSMVWYRQLQAGVPGSYRVFANLISYGQRSGSRTQTEAEE